MSLPEDPTPWWMNTETWQSQDGTVRKLEDLAPLHRFNIIARAHRRVDHTRAQYSWWWLRQMPSEMDGDAIWEYYDAEAYRIETEPDEEFIESLPLIKRLREIDAPPEPPRRGPRLTVELEIIHIDPELFKLLTGLTDAELDQLRDNKEGTE